jgi:hypothetical protein
MVNPRHIIQSNPDREYSKDGTDALVGSQTLSTDKSESKEEL